MGKTSIEWTDVSWPVVNGCRRISPGCGGARGVGGCYAERLISTRLRHMPKYAGLATFGKHGPQWSGKSRLWAPDLMMPFHLRTASRIFVADMGDLFYEEVSDEDIDRVFAVILICTLHETRGGHTFQILTKRAGRMRDYLTRAPSRSLAIARCAGQLMKDGDGWHDTVEAFVRKRGLVHPRIWLGVSVEDQRRADERVPELLVTPAATRFVSCEPLLEEVSLWAFLKTTIRDASLDALRSPPMPGLDWVIVGGESGSGARDFRYGWADVLRKQCAAAGVPFFFKQAGARALGVDGLVKLRARKGNDLSEIPERLRVREFPRVTEA